MYCWGSTVNGELGVGAPEVEQLTLPSFMDFSKSWNVKQVASGLMHSLILTEEGLVYSCGNNEVGQLGQDKITRKPEQIDDLQNYSIVQVAAGDQHSIALTSWGLIYAWGANEFGQLGINSTEWHTPTPKLVKSLARKHSLQIACGSNHTLALTSDGDLYSWGQNNMGQLGLGHKEGPQKEPALVKSLVGSPLVLITAGGHHSAALTHGGFLLTWGSNKYGQLGYTPKKDPNLSFGHLDMAGMVNLVMVQMMMGVFLALCLISVAQKLVKLHVEDVIQSCTFHLRVSCMHLAKACQDSWE
ncbi:hypothetical protein OTU49_007871 [Cherax quadricarinatus]|uniref:RCC1-like domain-containing protein n=1 Tax=Cherax quadricarinatus TaxID=27406 RepID=A0AAW0WTG9_CHEQU